MSIRIWQVFVLSWWLCLAEAGAQSIADARHFSSSDIQQAGVILQKRTVKISSDQRALLLAEVKESESQKERAREALQAALSSEKDDIPYSLLLERLDSPVVQHAFRTHEDALVRFRVNLKLAASGDVESAKLLCRLFHTDDIPQFDARAIRTGLLDLGIDPSNATFDGIIKHLQELRMGMVRLQPGEAIADLRLVDTQGKSFKLSDFRGKVVFLHFWATNCGPCMAQMPEIRDQIDAFPEGQVEVVFVSLDYDKEAFHRVQEKLGIACQHVCDGRSVSGDVAKHFRIDRMPVDIVLDREGNFASYSLSAIPDMID